MYELAADQSRQPEPFCAASLLTFHDAVELFLQLAAEHLGVRTSPQSFMDYWGKLEPKLGDDLTQKRSMDRLNKARVGLKHHGNRPSTEDIDGFRVVVANFFLENTPIVFGIEFADATLINFVKPESARQQLMQARASQEQGNHVDALMHAAIAFHEVIERPLLQMGATPLGRISSLWSQVKGLSTHEARAPSSQGSKETIRVIESLHKELESVSSTVSMLSLGLDPHRFARFRSVTPAILKPMGGSYRAVLSSRSHEKASEADVEFCVDFVIEAAIRVAALQV
jgi:hypothetical protein